MSFSLAFFYFLWLALQRKAWSLIRVWDETHRRREKGYYYSQTFTLLSPNDSSLPPSLPPTLFPLIQLSQRNLMATETQIWKGRALGREDCTKKRRQIRKAGFYPPDLGWRSLCLLFVATLVELISRLKTVRLSLVNVSTCFVQGWTKRLFPGSAIVR